MPKSWSYLFNVHRNRISSCTVYEQRKFELKCTESDATFLKCALRTFKQYSTKRMRARYKISFVPLISCYRTFMIRHLTRKDEEGTNVFNRNWQIDWWYSRFDQKLTKYCHVFIPLKVMSGITQQDSIDVWV